MHILIATGIYPPELGGPSQYAYNLEKTFNAEGYSVSVKYFTSIEKSLPTGLRHLYYAGKTAWTYLQADQALVLDTFSVALPIYLLSLCFGKLYTIRTGGDFLWESYVERTKKKVLFADFYKTEISNFTKKEKFIYWITKKILHRAQTVVFSTSWQRDIWMSPYKLNSDKVMIVENYYDVPKLDTELFSDNGQKSSEKAFITSSRDLVWKNKDITLRALLRLQKDFPQENIVIDNKTYAHYEYMQAIQKSYAVVLMSLGDISPNTILDSIRCGKPFLLTEENGIMERIQNLGVFAKPLDEEDIYQKVKTLLDPEVYNKLQQSIRNFSYTHTWKNIAEEYMKIWKR